MCLDNNTGYVNTCQRVALVDCCDHLINSVTYVYTGQRLRARASWVLLTDDLWRVLRVASPGGCIEERRCHRANHLDQQCWQRLQRPPLQL